MISMVRKKGALGQQEVSYERWWCFEGVNLQTTSDFLFSFTEKKKKGSSAMRKREEEGKGRKKKIKIFVRNFFYFFFGFFIGFLFYYSFFLTRNNRGTLSSLIYATTITELSSLLSLSSQRVAKLTTLLSGHVDL